MRDLQTVLAEATPGPWFPSERTVRLAVSQRSVAITHPHGPTADAELIAYGRQAVDILNALLNPTDQLVWELRDNLAARTIDPTPLTNVQVWALLDEQARYLADALAEPFIG